MSPRSRPGPPSATLAVRDHRPRVAAFALVVTLLASVVGLAPGTTAPVDVQRLVVGPASSVADAAAAVARLGGRVVEHVTAFGLLVAEVPTTLVDDLAADPAIGATTPDVPMRVQAANAPAPARPGAGNPTDPDAGDGVGVVLVDTGVADHPDLDDRLVARYDLAPGESADDHGHGTFLAGMVAGSGASSDGAHAGVAPSAHLVSVRVADANGETTLTRVLHGLAVADAARVLHDAPVVLLALAGPAGDVPDPIMIALEMLWARGSTVVVPAGNDGDAPGSIGSPGADPYVITAGALDDQGTVDPADDVVAGFSSRGPSPWGHAKPDLVAPGVSVVGLRAPGSTIDVANPDARVEDAYFRGTGTSMAAAAVAGAAATVLAEDPSLTPDEVKGRLRGGTASAPAGAGINDAGAGVLDIDGAVASDAGAANTELAPLPTPRNADQVARAVAPGQLRRTANGLEPAGWTWTGWTWTGWTWTGAPDGEWAGWTWTGGPDAEGTPPGDWAGWTWTGWSWTGWSWTGWSWTGWSWTGWSWTGWSWASEAWGDDVP